MLYSKSDFDQIASSIDEILFENGEPISCKLYLQAAENIIRLGDGSDLTHIPAACNIATAIDASRLLLTLPTQDSECSDLSEVLIISLDLIREKIRAYAKYNNDDEKLGEEMIRSWSGLIKHPRGAILAHRCFEGSEVTFDAIINFEVIKSWRNKDYKAILSEYSDKIVSYKIPTPAEIADFFSACRERI